MNNMKRFSLIGLLVLLASILFLGCPPPEIESTKLYLQKNQYDEAEQQARLATEKYPANPLGYFYLGKVLYQKENYSEMVQAFDKAIELGLDAASAKEVANYKKSAFAKSYNAAVKDINTAQGTDDETQKKELYESAYRHAKDAYLCDPEFFPTYNMLIQLALNLGKNDEALEIMTKAENSFASNDTVLYYVGRGYEQLGQNEKAFELYMKAEKINPNNIDVLKAVIDMYLAKEDYESAQGYLKKLAESQPDDPVVAYTIAAVYYKIEKFDEAAIHFEKLVQLTPDNADNWVLYINSLLQSQQFEKAEKASKEALESFPENADLWQQYAIALLRNNKKKEAEEAFKKYQELSGNK